LREISLFFLIDSRPLSVQNFPRYPHVPVSNDILTIIIIIIIIVIIIMHTVHCLLLVFARESSDQLWPSSSYFTAVTDVTMFDGLTLGRRPVSPAVSSYRPPLYYDVFVYYVIAQTMRLLIWTLTCKTKEYKNISIIRSSGAPIVRSKILSNTPPPAPCRKPHSSYCTHSFILFFYIQGVSIIRK